MSAMSHVHTPPLKLTVADVMAPAAVQGWQRRAGILAVVAALASLLGFFLNPQEFFPSYLLGFMLCLGAAFGSLGMLMVSHLSGGRWAVVLRRPFEAAAQTMPVLAVLFIPIWLGRTVLYAWSRPADVARDSGLQHLRGYLNLPWVTTRAVIYFFVWIVITRILVRYSNQQDAGQGGTPLKHRLENVSGVGLLLGCITISFAAIDWVMSLLPAWSSSIFGLIVLAGEGLTTIALMVILCSKLAQIAPFNRIYTRQRFHELGKWMLMFVLLFAYFSFSQLLIIWSGNIPDEIKFYLLRINAGWLAVTLLFVIGHFALPFALLLSSSLKKKAGKLALLAAFILCMRWVELYWLVFPNVAGHAHLNWQNVTVPLALGSVWVVAFLHFLRQRPLLPLLDPQMDEILREASGAKAH
ncbi:MAG: hypothetical protein ACYC6M_07430 [Terriglobales bacterium]